MNRLNFLTAALCSMVLLACGSQGAKDPVAVVPTADADADLKVQPGTGMDTTVADDVDVLVPPDAGTDASPDTADTPDVAPDTSSSCKVDTDCNDKDGCTIDVCQAGECQHVAQPGCSEPVPVCNVNADCAKGVCDTASHACVACIEPADCGAGVWQCAAHACVPASACVKDTDCKAFNQVCGTDGTCVACNETGDCASGLTCTAHACVAGQPCKSSKDCDSVCDLTTGQCSPCLKSSDCETGEYCAAQVCLPVLCKLSVCQGNSWLACNADGSGYDAKVCDDGNACTDDSCDSAKGCVTLVNAATCTDGDACTVADSCKSSACAPGTAVVCEDGNPCTDDSCTKTTGCLGLPNIATCTDGDACTTGDLCKNGTCGAGVAVACDDANPCTTEACVPSTGCLAQPVANGKACGKGGTCQTGSCVGPQVLQVAAGGWRTCALLQPGGVTCWGQATDPDTPDVLLPTAVTGLDEGVQAIALGEMHGCALLDDGGVRCWGQGGAGVMPVPVLGLAGKVKAITLGNLHSCALLQSGAVNCWGLNGNGELGNGATYNSWTAVPVTGLDSGVQAISAGGVHTCALMQGGSVKCWGSNSGGGLGDGTLTGKSVPVAVVGLAAGAQSIATGGKHSCALLQGGVLQCWGWNLWGQIGKPSSSFQMTPVTVANLGAGATSVTAGTGHTCAILQGGTVKCWGLDVYGQLGDGNLTNSATPVAVSGLAGAQQISAGWEHTCALAGDKLRCWGGNLHGQLGLGSAGDKWQPAALPALATSVTAITAGSRHNCALKAGTLQCWGHNDHGQVGDGSLIDKATPGTLGAIAGDVQSLALGGAHTCALMTSGNVQCWGQNADGQLGNGTKMDSAIPTQVTAVAGDAQAIAAGDNHTCALLYGGEVKCWGANNSNQLGASSGWNALAPVTVPGLGADVVTIEARGNHSCALTSAGNVSCWGSNPSGSSSPTWVQGLAADVQAISLGTNHTCALLTTGAMQCWGNNETGQYGDGTGVSKGPTPISSLGVSVLAIAAGEYHTCALLQGGSVKCWGSNYDGMLGIGSKAAKWSPVAVTGLGAGVVAIATGNRHTCAVLQGGVVECWGSNAFGQIGDGTAWKANAQFVEGLGP